MTCKEQRPSSNFVSFALLGLLSIAGSACGDDDGSDAGANSDSGDEGDPSQATDGEGSGTAGDPADGSGSAGEADQSWIVGTWISTDEEYLGYLSVVDDISAGGSIDLGRAVEFAGDMVYASPGGGVVYVGLGDQPTIQRWTANGDELVMDGEVSLANFGVTNTLGGGRNVIQFVDDELAYYFDEENWQVVKFNPAEMTTIGSFPIDGLYDDNEWVSLNFIHKDGTRFISTAAYWSLADDTGTPLVRAVIVDSADESVTYADDTRCGVIGFDAADAEGNLYFATHPGQSVSLVSGSAGDSPAASCMLRINSGEDQFDPEYFVDLSTLSGTVAGGLHPGVGNQAYIMHYTGDVAGITLDNERDTLRSAEWALYSVELGNEAATYAPVQVDSLFTAYADSFKTVVDGRETSYLVGVSADFGSGQYFDISDSNAVTEALTFPGFPGHAVATH
ncbi:MAG: hypothetical protein AAF799_45695 [Myxococcota bacterium]